MLKFRRPIVKGEFWASIAGFALVAVLIFISWIGNFFLMPWIFPSQGGGAESAGAAGDMFGALTALFSGLAFAGLITTLFMQRKELEYQRSELRQTREVFQVQRFENTFFGLLKLLNEHVQSIRLSMQDLGYVTNSRDDDEQGKLALVLIAQSGMPKSKIDQDYLRRYNDSRGHLGEEKDQILLIEEYNDRFHRYLEPHLGPYFRIIFGILRHIENQKFDEDDGKNEEAKTLYAKILRSHLNSSEIRLLMFNCASVQGAGLKHWVEKYSMLRHISRADYVEYKKIVDLYQNDAFDLDSRKGTPLRQ